jgi:flagellin
MALNSINTNMGAMVALQNLNKTNNELGTTQNRINTGMKVSSAKDNGAVWAIAQGQRAEVSSLGVVKDSLARGQSVVDVAMAGGESISDLLIEMKTKALAAQDTTLSTDSRTALANDFNALRDQIGKVVENADFDGANMLKASGQAVAATANPDGVSTSKITVAAQDLSLGGANLVGVTTSTTFTDAATAKTVATAVDAAIGKVSTALAALGTGSKSLSIHSDFMSKLSDSLEAGVGKLVDADLAKESAKLQALQTKQQLGIQALSIANGSAGSLLGLFR